MNKFLTFLFSICFISILHAQPNTQLWQRIDESAIKDKGERRIIPQKYATLSMDKNALRTQLNTAPWRDEVSAKNSKHTLQFPLPDGNTETFTMVKTAVMHPELAAQFPEITTYEGQGTIDQTAILKLDITPHGVHGFILSDKYSTVFLDPYSFGNDRNYILYYKKDFSTTKKMDCDIAEDNITGLQGRPASPGGDCQLRTYRLAVAATGEYTAYQGGTQALALAAQVTTMNRVNGVFEKDLAITMQLIANNSNIVYTNSGTDPYTNGNTGAMINENQSNIDGVIGSGNYDLGHVFGTNSGGLAGLGVLCSNGSKARGVTGSGAPSGDPFDIDYVAHEMGHQLGANHTQNNNCNRNSSTAMEPGSASTILGYAGICSPDVQSNSDDYFHAVSIREMQSVIQSAGCGTTTDDGNSNPTVNAGLDYTIPAGTFFELEATGSDPNGGSLTYCWEQMDNTTATMPPASNSTDGPAFRSFDPVSSNIRIFPDINNIVANTTPTWEVISSSSRTYNFTVTLRDNNAGQGCTYDDDMTITASNTGASFTVTQPNTTGISWTGLSTQTVTWNVAGSSSSPINTSNVDIFLSTDGGYTYPITVATGVANTGSASITVPNNPTTTARIKVKGSNNIFFDISNNNFTITAPSIPDFTLAASPATSTVCAPTNGTYTVTTGSVLSFSNPITLSASGNPAGTSVSFSPNPVTPGNTSTMTISGTGSAAVGTSTITVSGTATSGTHTDDVSLTISNTPAAVTLSTPVNTATNQSLTPNYTWTASSGATSYTIQVSTNAAFTGIVDNQTVATNSYTSGITLNITTQYYWRVRAINSCGNSAFSSTFSFTTGSVSYCTPTFTNGTTDGDFIDGVVLGTINNTGTGTQGAADYFDYTSMSTNLTQGSGYSIDITSGNFSPDNYAVMIDFNQDGDFSDANEYLGLVSSTAIYQTNSIAFSVPATALTGSTRMRVRCVWNEDPIDPCLNYGYGETEDYTVVIQAPTCATTISSFPYNEDFESFTLCSVTSGSTCTLANNWTNETSDDIDWSTDEGGTPSANTGPVGVDYNPGTATGNYLYTESSTNGTGYPNKVAIATTPCFDLSSVSSTELGFAYNMYGATTGTLNVDVSTDVGLTWTNAWSLSGNQGNSWSLATVDLSAYDGQTIKIRFRGVTGTGLTSDMAIDDVSIQSSSSCTVSTPTASGNSRCGTGTVGLSATPGSGGTICRWYTASTGGTLLATSNTYTTPSIATSTTYYVCSYDGSSCESGRIAVTATVNTIPTVNFSGLPATACDTASASTLTGSPVGGTFSGTGISGNTFNPASAGAGTYSITYSYTDGNGCSNTSSQNVTVNSCGLTNDDCTGALTVTCGTTTSGTTTGATIDAPTAGACGAGGPTSAGVWYYFAGTGDAVNVSTCNNATYDTRLSVYSGTCGSLSCVAGNDDGTGCSGFTSELNFNSVSGTDYYILVHGYSTNSGDFDLTITCTPPCTPIPTNDDCASAATLTVEASGSCTLTVGTNECASAALSNPSCDAFGVIQDVWYTFNSGADTSIIFSIVNGTSSNIGYALYDACGGTEIYCNTPGTDIQDTLSGFTTSTDYWIQIWNGGSVEAGTFTICLEGEAPCAAPATPTISASGATTFCSGNSVTLTSSSSINNQWNLNGSPIGGATNSILVVSASGNYTVTVTNGCGNTTSGTTSVTVNPLPTVSFSGLGGSYCVDASSVTLTGSPTGGTFSGNGISGNTFNPATAGTGTHTITYSYTNGSGCTNTSTQNVTINTLPTVSFSGLPATVCDTAAASTLTGSPAGGTFSGNGISGNTFDPATAGAGTHTITYSYTNGSGCTNTSSQNVTVNSCGLTNDDCTGALTVTCGTTTSGTTTGATIDAPTAGACGAGGPTSAGVWYYFAGTGDAVNVSTCNNATYDTRLSVYSGTCGSLSCVAGNDDGTGCSGFTSELNFNSVSGTDYYILVHGYSTNSGDFDLTITCTPPCTPIPTNDDCASAATLTVEPSGSCTPTVGTNECASAALSNPSCDAFGVIQDVWYTFNSGADTSIIFSIVNGTSSNIGYALYDACGGTEVYCNTPGTDIQDTLSGFTTSTDYWIQIWNGGSVEAGTFTICLEGQNSCTPPATPTISASGATSICIGNSVTLTSSSSINNQWNLNGSPIGGATNSILVVSASGNYTVTVTNGCGNTTSGTTSVTVNPLPTVSFSGLGGSYCVDASSVTLTGSPTGGTFSGNGISGNTFDPATAGAGTHTITYSYTNGSGCTNTSSQNVTINALPVVSISNLNGAYCLTSGTATITGSPAGGTFSGTGVSGNTFDPAAAGIGSYTITYAYTDGSGCSNTISQAVDVLSSPTASITMNASYCSNEPSFAVTVSPVGGTLSGPGVSGGNFDPSTAGAGTHTLIYTFTAGAGCSDADTVTVIVHAAPAGVTFTGLNSTYCDNDSASTLTGTPSGGVFSGAGISGSSFDPVAAGIGADTITYTYTDGNGCSASTTQSTTVSVSPVATISGLSNGYCDTDTDVILTLNPAGGTLTGNGVSGNIFSPSTAGAGTHDIVYTYSSGGCSDSDTITVTISASGGTPTASFTTNISSMTATFTNTSTNASSWNWTFGDGTAAISENPTHTYGAEGTYTVCLVVGNACGGQDSICSSITIDTTSGPGSIVSNLDDLIFIYPNPSGGVVNVEMHLTGNVTAHITDVLGRQVMDDINIVNPDKYAEKWDMSVLESGVYFVKIQVDNNVVIKRLVIEK